MASPSNWFGRGILNPEITGSIPVEANFSYAFLLRGMTYLLL